MSDSFSLLRGRVVGLSVYRTGRYLPSPIRSVKILGVRIGIRDWGSSTCTK